MSITPPVTMPEWMRQQEKNAAMQSRRPNMEFRVGVIEEELSQLSGRNRYINARGRTNQTNYVSGTFLGPLGYCVDMLRVISTQINLASNPVGVLLGASNTLGYITSLGTLSVITGLTIPGLASVTTAVRSTFSGASTTGLLLDGAVGRTTPVVAGQTYIASWWLRSSVNKTVGVNIEWKNAAGVSISATSGTPVALVANTWTRVSVSGTAPALAVYAGPYSYQTSGNWATANTLDMTGVLVELGSTLNAFYMPPKADFTAAPQGQVLALSGADFVEVLERANMEAGTYTVSWGGTSQGRLYNVGGSVPTAVSSPFTVTLDGLADVNMHWTPGTLDKVQIERGTVATTFEYIPVGVELAQCQRHYWRINNPTGAPANMQFANGAFYSTAIMYCTVYFPVEMRAAPTGRLSSVGAFLMQYQGVSATSNGGGVDTLSVRSARVNAQTPGASASGYSGWLELKPGFYVEFDARL